MVLFPMTLNEH